MEWTLASRGNGPRDERRAAEWRKVALVCAGLAVITAIFGSIEHWRTWW